MTRSHIQHNALIQIINFLDINVNLNIYDCTRTLVSISYYEIDAFFLTAK